MASQMSKTDGIQLNVMGHRIDDDPVPILYIGPTKAFVEKVIHPRIKAMINDVETLREKQKIEVKPSKTQKEIAGVKIRLAWAHSATELAGDPAGIVLLDERDRMPNNIGGEGDPKEIADARHSTYSDGTTIVTSTPTIGTVETYIDPITGFEHWKESDDIGSPTWKLWQEGTRHEWAWPCPECKEYFIPRFKLLQWPEGAAPKDLLKNAQIACPCCGSLIDDSKKTKMNARGVFVAPGQTVNTDGTVIGDLPDSDTYSTWTSGLCSPWRTFGQRASAFLKAVRSGDSERIQAAINTGFGELFAVSGDAPDWEEVAAHKQPYRLGQTPSGVLLITATVDVQKDRLIYIVRGWGINSESWLIEAGEILGDTLSDDVWDTLSEFKTAYYNDITIKRMIIDSGYRTDVVYEFCRIHQGWAIPSKGHDSQDKPIKANAIDITVNGKVQKGGLQLWHIDTNYFKTWVHDRIKEDKSRWHLPEDIDDDYCKQIVAEAKVVKPSGREVWVRVKKDNHYLDCESLSFAAAHSLKVHLLIDNSKQTGKTPATNSTKPDNNWIGGSLDNWLKR